MAYGSQLVAKPQYLAVLQEHDRIAHEIEIQLAAHAEAAEAARTAAAALAQTERDFAERLSRAQADAEAKAALLARDLERLDEKRRRTTLAAPVAGTVTDLAVHTTGEVVKAGQVLLRVVPDDGAFEIEVEVPTRDAGFVEPGMPAVIKIDAFPYVRHGHLRGRVKAVSADVKQKLAEAGTRPAAPTFAAVIEITERAAFEAALWPRLGSGHTVVVDIASRQRTVAEYFLEAGVRGYREALRER